MDFKLTKKGIEDTEARDIVLLAPDKLELGETFNKKEEHVVVLAMSKLFHPTMYFQLPFELANHIGAAMADMKPASAENMKKAEAIALAKKAAPKENGSIEGLKSVVKDLNAISDSVMDMMLNEMSEEDKEKLRQKLNPKVA